MRQSQDHVNCVFDWEGVVRQDYALPGQTINKEYYFNIACQLRGAIQRRQLQLWAASSSAHTLRAEFFGGWHQITQVTQLLQPKLGTLLLLVFPKLKSLLKGKRFQTVTEIQENTTGQLMAIPTKDFAECFEQWKRCWENCVRSQGANFEGDWGVIVLCTIYLISRVFFSVSLFHITWLDSSGQTLYVTLTLSHLKTKTKPSSITLLLRRMWSLDLKHWNHWKRVRNTESQALSETYWKRTCVSVREIPRWLYMYFKLCEAKFPPWDAGSYKEHCYRPHLKPSQTEFKFMTYF